MSGIYIGIEKDHVWNVSRQPWIDLKEKYNYIIRGAGLKHIEMIQSSLEATGVEFERVDGSKLNNSDVPVSFFCLSDDDANILKVMLPSVYDLSYNQIKTENIIWLRHIQK